MFPLPDEAMRVFGYRAKYGSTVTGLVDSFGSFWYFGCFKFFHHRHGFEENLECRKIRRSGKPVTLHAAHRQGAAHRHPQHSLVSCTLGAHRGFPLTRSLVGSDKNCPAADVA